MSEPERRRVFTVSRLNQEVQKLLEGSFGTLWLQGELSNLARPGSGHWYFSLKDSQAQVRCAMFRARARNVDPPPANGDAVLVRGRLSLYTARGDFQLIVEHLEPAGAGRLQAAFEKTRRQLEAAGWFDPARRRAPPALPATIGVVTSSTGAAIRDVLQVLARRYPQARIIIYPTLVQGAQAAPAVAAALQRAARRREVDVLLLVRGGGSLEDLWAFNEVVVADAIRQSPVPVVSGVGHEVDVTIADLVADVRAPTPSAAAELATPDAASLGRRVSEATSTLTKTMHARRSMLQRRLQGLEERLQARHPIRRLAERAQRVDELEARLVQATRRSLQQRRQRRDALSHRLILGSPQRSIERARETMTRQLDTLHSHIDMAFERRRAQWANLARALHAVSPLATLGRGFAVVVDEQSQVLTDASSLQPGQRLHTRLAAGSFASEVLDVTGPD